MFHPKNLDPRASHNSWPQNPLSDNEVQRSAGTCDELEDELPCHTSNKVQTLVSRCDILVFLVEASQIFPAKLVFMIRGMDCELKKLDGCQVSYWLAGHCLGRCLPFMTLTRPPKP